ncbi:MAG: hypothetical protein QNL62_05510 [Gammaproteobacteria bacterium]|nr:hypothetical protein [Gammaproteobacteria bacterium]
MAHYIVKANKKQLRLGYIFGDKKMTVQAFIEPKTLGEFNNCLSTIKLPTINLNQFKAIKETEPKARLINALQQAGRNTNALTYLKNIINKAMDDVTAANDTNHDSNNNNHSTQTQHNAPEHNGGNKQTNSSETNDFLNYHVYGGSYALDFKATKNRKNVETISIDAAVMQPGRTVNWADKICVQLTKEELVHVAGVIFGIITECEYSQHGPAHDKGFKFQHQGSKVFINVMAKNKKAHSVPMTTSDAYYVGNLFLRQLQLTQPWLTCGEILTSLRVILTKMNKNDNNNNKS